MSKHKLWRSMSLVGAVSGAYLYWREQQKWQRGKQKAQVFDVNEWQARLPKSVVTLSQVGFEQDMTELALPYLTKHAQKGVLELADVSLHYVFYRCVDPLATVVVVHGFNEIKEKYQELVYYWLQQRIQVLVYDARGHGQSRSTHQSTKIDIQHFDTYVEDLAVLIQQVVQPESLHLPLTVYGHSMGGAVATRLAQLYPESIDRLIISAPMLAINTGNVPLSAARWLSRLSLWAGKGEAYAPRMGEFDPERHTAYPQENRWAFEWTRGQYFHQQHLRLHPQPTWGGSWNWLATSLATTHQLLKSDWIQRIKTPVLIFQGEFDTHVLAKGIYRLAQQLANCELYFVPQVKHEMYLESDQFVQAYVAKTSAFMLAAKKGKNR